MILISLGIFWDNWISCKSINPWNWFTLGYGFWAILFMSTIGLYQKIQLKINICLFFCVLIFHHCKTYVNTIFSLTKTYFVISNIISQKISTYFNCFYKFKDKQTKKRFTLTHIKIVATFLLLWEYKTQKIL